MKRGIYRVSNEFMDESARVGWQAGDGAPYLTRDIYEMLGFQPPFDALPERDEFLRTHPDLAKGMSRVPAFG